MEINGSTILITGGTGSFGRKFVEVLLNEYNAKKIIILSRDEHKQYEMRQQFNDHPKLRFFLGDVRDLNRLYRAFEGVDIVVHAAALKQVPAAEYNPIEPVKTNILGGANVIDAAIDKGVKRVVALSTDKAANPINLYGATKLVSDKLFVAANSYRGDRDIRFSVVRYGNVMGSRGSVLPLFEQMKETGKLPITDRRMTRFWITLDQGVRFVLRCIDRMYGGEIFVPKIPSIKITDLAEAIAPGCELEEIGIRPGEKLHEVMIPEEDALHTVELDDCFIIKPQFNWWGEENWNDGKPLPEGFSYRSDKNTHWLSVEEIRQLLKEQGSHRTIRYEES